MLFCDIFVGSPLALLYRVVGLIAMRLAKRAALYAKTSCHVNCPQLDSGQTINGLLCQKWGLVSYELHFDKLAQKRSPTQS